MRYNKILKNKLFLNLINEINELEIGRRFCGHNIDHLFDVARTAYIISLENNLAIDKDVIYATALLHDIGRVEEYKSGIPHDVAGCEIAKEILKQTDYTEDETEEIINVISNHRNTLQNTDYDLCSIIYMADKLTRKCFACKATAECNWSDNKKNFEMRY